MPRLHYSNFEAIGLDFDGTLADTRSAHTQARLAAFDRMAKQDKRYEDVPHWIHNQAHYYGQTSEEIIAWVLQAAGITEELDLEVAQQMVEIKNEIYWDQARQGFMPITDAPMFIKQSSTRFMEMGIVSTAYRGVEILPFLQAHNLTSYFMGENIVGREDTNKTKPDPEPYELLIGRLDIDPDQLLVIEDNARGIESAKRAGSVVVALTTTHTAAEIDKYEGYQKPDDIASSFSNLAFKLGFE